MSITRAECLICFQLVDFMDLDELQRCSACRGDGRTGEDRLAEMDPGDLQNAIVPMSPQTHPVIGPQVD